MNALSLTVRIFIFTLGLSVLVSGENDKPVNVVPKKLPTHEEINQAREKHRKIQKTVRKDIAEKPIVNIKPRSLIARSTLLANAGKWTLVPKGAVLHLPGHLKDKVVTKPTGKLVKWKEFYLKNAGWLHIHAVRMTQAQGKEALKPEVIKAYQSMGKVVVATCAGGPISVAPDALKTEAKEDK